MPVPWSPNNTNGTVYSVPDYAEAADGPAAFKSYSAALDPYLPPVGALMPYVGTTAPTGWLLCDGREYENSQYQALAKLCTPYGSTGTKFRVPDLRGRFPIGVDPSDKDFDTLGKKNGTKAVTLVTANLPKHEHTTPIHSHTATSSGKGTFKTTGVALTHSHVGSKAESGGVHKHDTKIQDANNFNRNASANGAVVTANNTNNLTADGGAHTHTITITADLSTPHEHGVDVDFAGASIKVADAPANNTGSVGDGTPVLTLGPYLTFNWIVRAG